MLNNKNKRSFSLIELLITVTIIILFTGLSLAYYNNYTEDLKLDSEAKKLVNVLELAKKKASVGDLYSSCDSFNGYQVSVSSGSYSLYFCCGACSASIKTYNLSNNLTITLGTGNYIFNKLVNRVTIPETGNVIRIKNTSLNKCIDITVNETSIIETGQKSICSLTE